MGQQRLLKVSLLFAALALAPIARADTGDGVELKARFVRLEEPNVLKVLVRDERSGAKSRTLLVGQDALARLKQEIDLGLVKQGVYLGLSQDASERVTAVRRLVGSEIEPIELTRGPSATPRGRPGDQVIGWAAQLSPDTPVLVNGEPFLLVEVNQALRVLVLRRHDEDSRIHKFVDQITRYEVDPNPPSATGPTIERRRFVPGDLVKLQHAGEERYGTVEETSGGAATVRLKPIWVLKGETYEPRPEPGGTAVAVAVEALARVDPARFEEATRRPEDPVVEVQPPPVETRRPVRVVFQKPALDVERNVYTVVGLVQHDEQDRLLLKADVSIVATSEKRFNGDADVWGRMVPPEVEAEIVELHGTGRGHVVPPGGVLHGPFVHRPFYFRDEQTNGVVIADLSDAPASQAIELGPIFTSIPERFRFETVLFNPKVKVELVYADEDLVALDDPRVVPALVTAYAAEGPYADLKQRAALAAMAKTKDARLVPFLFWQHYLAVGDPARLESALATFDRGMVERFLIGLLEDEQSARRKNRPWKPRFDILAADGTRRVEEPQNPDLALASTLRIMSALGSEKAFPYALEQLRRRDPAVAAAAERVFLAKPDRAANWLVHRAHSSAEARALLTEIEVSHPGKLLALLTALERSLNAEVPRQLVEELKVMNLEERSQRLIREIASLVAQHRLELNPVLVEANGAVEQLKGLLASAPGESQAAARSLVDASRGRPPADADHRHWRVELLRKALYLDPSNQEARRDLALKVREVAQELGEGAAVRLGPGADYARLTPLELGAVFAPTKPPTGSRQPALGDWIPIDDRGKVSFVHSGSARRGSRAVLAVRDALPPAEVIDLLQQAMRLDPEGRGRYLDQIAELYAHIATEAAREQRWDLAQTAYADALAHRSDARLFLSLTAAYLQTNTWVPLLALGLVFAAVVALLTGMRPAPPVSTVARGAPSETKTPPS